MSQFQILPSISMPSLAGAGGISSPSHSIQSNLSNQTSMMIIHDYANPENKNPEPTKFRFSRQFQDPQPPRPSRTRIFLEESAKAIAAPLTVVPALYLSAMLMGGAGIYPPEENFVESQNKAKWVAQAAGFGTALTATWVAMELFLTAMIPVFIGSAAAYALKS